MNTSIRITIMTVCATAVVGSVLVFAATGAYPYTRLRDPEIEAANSQTNLADLFSENAAAQAPPPRAVQSVNALGFFPSGPGLASISVATIAGPAAALMGLVGWFGRRSTAHAVSPRACH